MFKVTVKTLLARRFRLLSTGFAVVLGIAFLAGTLVLTATISNTFDTLFADAFAGVDAEVRGPKVFDGEQGAEDSRQPVDASLVEAVAEVDGVADAAGYVEAYAQLVGEDGEKIGDPDMAGTYSQPWLGDSPINSYQLAEGRGPEADDEVVLDRGGAKEGDYALGDEATVLSVLGTETYEVVGIATFGDEDTASGRHYVFVTDDKARELASSPDTYDAIIAGATEGVSQTELVERIRQAVPGDVEVITGEELTEENQSAVKEALGFFSTFLLVFAVIALLVGSFIIYNTFSILIAQRTRELALLRALGASRSQVRASVLLEALVVGVVASAVGIVAGVFLSLGLKALLSGLGFDIPATGIVLTGRTVVICMIVGVVVSLFSAFFPSLRASRVPPVAAMQGVAVDNSGTSLGRIIAGVLVLAFGSWNLAIGLTGRAGGASQSLSIIGVGAAIVFIAVAMLGPVFARPLSGLIGWPLPRLRGMAGLLARQNAMRNPRRTSTTAAALMIGVGLVIVITVLVSSIKASIIDTVDETFRADFVVTVGGFGLGGLSPTVAEELSALPTVEAATGTRYLAAQVDGEGSGQTMTVVDPPTFQEVWALEFEAGSLDDLGADGIAVDSAKAEGEGWEVGDELTLTFAETGEHPFRVAAIFAADSGLFTQYVIGREAADANSVDRLDQSVYIINQPGVTAEEGREAVESVAAAYPTAEVQDQATYKQSLTDQLNQLLALIIVLLFLAVLIALFGIANTLSLSIHERTRELGLLRAVGMTRGQLRATVRWESVVIALLGVFLGVVIGGVFGWLAVTALKDQGLSAFRIPWSQVVLVVVVGGIAGVVAALRPASRAARLNVLDAIASD